MVTQDLRPHSPLEGPPLPRTLPGWPWRHRPNPASKVTEKSPQEVQKPVSNPCRSAKGGKDEEYQIVLKRRGPNPTWLAEHQERFSKATIKAAAETKHLSGTERVSAMHQLVSKYMRGGGDEKAEEE